MPSTYVNLAASTAQTVVVSNGDPVLDEIADAPDRYLIPAIDELEVVNVDGDDIVYFTYDFAAGFNAASAGAIPPAPTIAGAGTTAVPAEPGEYVRIRAPQDHNIVVVRAISAGTPRIGVSALTRGGERGDDPDPGGAAADYAPYSYNATADNPDTVIGALSPFGYWKCNDASGNPQDSSGNGNHATAADATVTYSQAPLSAKVGNSIALTAGGRLHMPSLGVTGTMGGNNEDYTIICLLMFTGAGSDPDGVVFMTESQANTVALWGYFLDDAQATFLTMVSQGIRGVTNRLLHPPLNTPFVFASRGSGAWMETWVNGVLVGTQLRGADGAAGSGWDIGQNLGDSFFGMPPMRVSNVAGWSTALTDTQILTVSEALMDSTMMAAATVVYP